MAAYEGPTNSRAGAWQEEQSFSFASFSPASVGCAAHIAKIAAAIANIEIRIRTITFVRE
jgi:hypothetical protein